MQPSARPAGQVPDEPRIDRAEQGVAGLRRLARAGDVGEQPVQLEAGEIARQRQAGLGAQAILAAVGREARHQVVDPRVLPDECVAERFAGTPIPQKRGLALVRDADRGEVARAQSLRGERLLHDALGVAPDLERIVFDEAGRRVDLSMLALRHGGDAAAPVEDDEARAGRALVDGADVVRHLAPLRLA